MSKHTPWYTAAMNDCMYVIDKQPFPAGDPTVRTLADTNVICKLGPTREDAERARLIAAAPDLYDACKEMQEAWAYFSEYDVPINLKAKLDAAIAKAEGGDQ